MKPYKKRGCPAYILLFALILIPSALMLGGCSYSRQPRIVRIGHNQSTSHPTHIALAAFRDYIHEHMEGRYQVEVCPFFWHSSQNGCLAA